MNIDDNRDTVAPAFLVDADSYSTACKKILNFLGQTTLIKYDSIVFDDAASCSAGDPEFWAMVDTALDGNAKSIHSLIQELETSGYTRLVDLAEMRQGYDSKILHILTHFLDGFIGFDSSFYNLIEDSHQLSDSLRTVIVHAPEKYWFVQVGAEKLWSFL